MYGVVGLLFLAVTATSGLGIFSATDRRRRKSVTLSQDQPKQDPYRTPAENSPPTKETKVSTQKGKKMNKSQAKILQICIVMVAFSILLVAWSCMWHFMSGMIAFCSMLALIIIAATAVIGIESYHNSST